MIFINKNTGKYESFEKKPSDDYLTTEEWIEYSQKQSQQERLNNGDMLEVERKKKLLLEELNNINSHSICLIRSIICGTAENDDLTTLKQLEIQARTVLKQLEQVHTLVQR